MSTPYVVKESRSYDASVETLFETALAAAGGLQGKVQQQDAVAGQFEAQFDKKILGKVLGDRTRIHVSVTPAGAGSEISAEIYPLDAIGRPLQFGARKGVSATVLSWFWAHLEHRLA